MIVLNTVDAVREFVGIAKRAGDQVRLVPTMGAFHDGHLSLMRRARADGGCVIVSLFVNPAQFNEQSDLEKYPRDDARDLRLAEEEGVSAVFLPAVREVYPTGFATSVEVGSLAAPLEGIVRGPQHFRGVATVVAKLFNIVQPDVAYFGQKDAQQALLIRQMARDLNVPVQIVVLPTVREDDGLAMSSRNALLDPTSRKRAPALSRALFTIAGAVASGTLETSAALDHGRRILDAEEIEPEYLAAVDARTLAPVERIEGETLIAIAARFGNVRLIDNVIVGR